MILVKKVAGTGSAHIGFAPYIPIACCPTNAQKAALYGKELDEDKPRDETQYEGTKDTDGNEQVILDFWFKACTPEGQIKNSRFYISKKQSISKNGSFQYVNQSGESNWASEADKLPSFFTNYEKFGSKESLGEKKYREAVTGEADLYAFLTKWFSDVNFKDPKQQSNILIDIDELFNNFNSYIDENFRIHIEKTNRIEVLEAELKEFFNKPLELRKGTDIKDMDKEVHDLRKESVVGPIVMLAYVKSVDSKTKPGEVNHNQKFFNEYLPTVLWFKKGAKMDSVETMKAISEAIESDNWTTYSALDKFQKRVTDKEYGIKDSYKLCLLEKFNPDEFLGASDETFVNSEEDDNNPPFDNVEDKAKSWKETRAENAAKEKEEFDDMGMPKGWGEPNVMDDVPF